MGKSKHRSHKFLNELDGGNVMSMIFKFIVGVGLVLGVVAFILVLTRKDCPTTMVFKPPGSLGGECIKVSDNISVCNDGLKCNTSDNTCVLGGQPAGALNMPCVMGANNTCRKGLACVSNTKDAKDGDPGTCKIPVNP